MVKAAVLVDVPADVVTEMWPVVAPAGTAVTIPWGSLMAGPV